MNKLIFIAAILSTITLFVHIIAGGNEVHLPILESTLSIELKAILSVIWHGITGILIINSLALWVAAKSEQYQKILSVVVSSQYFTFPILFIFYGYTQLSSIMIMPQWIAFVTISLLALLGSYKQKGVQPC